MPELTGSEKQVKWATEIRDGVLSAADANVRNAKRNAELGLKGTNVPSVAGAEWARKKAVSEMKAVTQASQIIDKRRTLNIQTLEKMGKYYDSQRK